MEGTYKFAGPGDLDVGLLVVVLADAGVVFGVEVLSGEVYTCSSSRMKVGV